MKHSQEEGQRRRSVFASYCLKYFFFIMAILSLLVAAGLLWPEQALESGFSWLIFYPLVIIVALYFGFYAGLFITAVACVSIIFLWPALLNHPYIENSLDLFKLAIFVITSSFISYYAEAVQKMAKALKQTKRQTAISDHNEQFIKSIIDNTPNMMGYWDKDLRCRYANKAYSQWFAMPAEQIIGLTFQELAGDKLFNLNEPHIRKVLAGEPQCFERKLQKADGSTGHIIGHYIPDFASDGSVRGFFIQSNEVTLLKETEAKLKLAACVFDNTLDGVVITDANGIILSVNPAFTEITGFSAQEVIGKMPRILQSNRQETITYEMIWYELINAGCWQGEVWNQRKDGEIYLQRLNISMVPDRTGEPVRYVSVFSDITELRRKDDHIKHLAFHDALTDLPNRTLLMDRIKQKLLSASREQCKLAVMFLDLDGFKQVNDTQGHKVGDALLKEVALRLMQLVRQSDTIARVGGDEFVFVLNNPQDNKDITDVANRIITAINQPFTIQQGTFYIGVSIGVSLFPEHGATAGELISNADKAMYIAKSTGKNKLSFFQQTELEQ
ncbi:diguanylate cyclase domain-containing protein [Rheinheimera sp. WS51]|uniref:diguanylate cyclase domain-containing protein n=1 Tax=Rheinheimera sp. WS51 TaxID=3425886 RepID=UPI003D8BFC00